MEPPLNRTQRSAALARSFSTGEFTGLASQLSAPLFHTEKRIAKTMFIRLAGQKKRQPNQTNTHSADRYYSADRPRLEPTHGSASMVHRDHTINN